jgi:HEAT repeat protein
VEARRAAALRLAHVESAESQRAREALVRLLEDAHPSVRIAAVRALAEHGEDAPVEPIAARLDDGDARVREEAVIALAQASAGQARDALRRALASAHPEVRFQAALGYAERFPADAAHEVTPLLSDPDAEVRANAARALGATTGAEAVPALEGALADVDARVRQEAAMALARRGATAPTDLLCDALADPDSVFDALDALGSPAHGAAADRVAAVASALFRPHVLKAAAARALVRMGDVRGVEILRRILHAWRTDARTAVVEIVRELALVELAEDLARLAARPRDTDPDTLRAALEALAPKSETARQALTALR